MTHTLAGLQNHDLVEIRPNPDDGRSKRVWLTRKGRTFRDQAITDLEPLFDQLADAMPPARIKPVLPVLEELRVFIDELRNDMR
jgi:DNA-binding MarR family transcriptional regulator